jgi:hypothetical protein
MANKFYRKNFRMGTNPFARKSSLQKITEVFGPKKKDKKPKKRMMANKGGGADFMNTVKPKKRGNPAVVKNVEEDTKRDQMKQPLKTTKKFKKGGVAKKKKKFPDMSGDGKVTMKDILMARGVIPKKKKTKKKVI